MRWAILKCVKIILFLVIVNFSYSVSADTNAVTIPDYELSDVKAAHDYICSAEFRHISVYGVGLVKACVMGEETRIAYYSPSPGRVDYYVSFPFENLFYRLNVCNSVLGCIYIEETDTFIDFSEAHRDFVKTLTKNSFNGMISYQPHPSKSFSVNRFADRQFRLQSIGVSNNGRWLALGMREYGIFRMNLQTSEIRRISVSGFHYDIGADPQLELAISDDGTTIAAIGRNAGMRIVKVQNNDCGDTPSEAMTVYYPAQIISCQQYPLHPTYYTTYFTHALKPRFSEDVKTFSFDVYSSTETPRHVTLYFPSRPTTSSLKYMAIGDSFTSGEGEIDDTFYVGGATNKCHSSTRSYPFLLAQSWNVALDSVACSGATIQSARGKTNKNNQPEQLAQVESQRPRITTIGIGGNDAGLVGKLKDCLGVGTCNWAKTLEDRQRTVVEVRNLYPKLRDFYEDINDHTLNSVIAVSYPRIISSHPNCLSPIGVLLNETERIFMNETIHYLNQVIRRAARDTGVHYIDIEQAFENNELCAVYLSPHMNAIRLGDDYPDIATLPFFKVIGAESFHPKPEGHVKIAEKILQTIPDIHTLTACDDCETSLVAPEPNGYWGSIDGDLRPQQGVPFIVNVGVKQGARLQVSLPKFSFKPFSSVTLELHSDIKQLGSFRANEEGSLQVTIPTEDFNVGSHSVHAIGKNMAGNEVDLYDFLMVEEGERLVEAQNIISTVMNTPQKAAVLNNKYSLVGSENVLGVTGTQVISQSPSYAKKSAPHAMPAAHLKQPQLINQILLALSIFIALTVIVLSVYIYYLRKAARNAGR